MPNPADIPHLLLLLEDDAPEVQANVREALLAFGEDLLPALQAQWQDLSQAHQRRAETFLPIYRKWHFQQVWPGWLQTADPYQALEQGMAALSSLQGDIFKPTLSSLLDEWAAEVALAPGAPREEELVRWLFREGRLGPPPSDYYHPRNSDLVQVIQQGYGLQISLSCIAMLLGKRLEIELYGVNVPRHFMLATSRDQGIVFDVFQKGIGLSIPRILASLSQRGAPVPSWESFIATPRDILMRVLRNLIHAHQRQKQQAEASECQDYLTQVEQAASSS